ncbi:lipocalin family protein [Mariprofundus erugo]|uniref:lipocalin family protein n=1 Tax=Mariprofundus erugo TaxID=2528639 RepID=UPI0026A79F52
MVVPAASLRAASLRAASLRAIGLLAVTVLVSACVAAPSGITPVSGFELNRYLGKWYEIARLDHSFERGLEAVTAEYSMREDGGVRAINRGYSQQDQAWKQAEGRAYFVDTPDTGHLKVSFFGPFYGAYVIFGLDHEQYRYSFISGPNRSFLWLLARTQSVPEQVITDFRQQAASLGFDIGQLHMVRHELPITAGSADDAQ